MRVATWPYTLTNPTDREGERDSWRCGMNHEHGIPGDSKGPQ